MQTTTGQPRRLREWEEEPKRNVTVSSASLPAGSLPLASVLPSTEIPPSTHPGQLCATAQDGSLQSQESERDKALAAWTEIFGGRQVDYGPNQRVPLRVVRHLGRGGGGSVDETDLGGIAVAWKRISTRNRRLSKEEMNEVQILKTISKRRHRHVVELIGSYTHRYKGGIELGMLIWPVAHCDLGHFLQDVDYLCDSLKEPPEGNISSEDLESVIDNLHPLVSEEEPPKNFSDQAYRHGLYNRALVYLRSKVGCIGQAVAYLHERDIRHKDLKPAQVLLSGKGLWLTDFGWSKDISQFTNSVTTGGHEITLKYHAPERTAGKPCGRPEDIFALGCIFLEMGYRLLRSDPQTNEIRLPWSAKKSFSASLENIDAWIAPFINQPHESLQHFGYVIKEMLHIDPQSRPTITGVTELLSMPYRKEGSTKISNSFVSSCCTPVQWITFCEVEGVVMPQTLNTIVDPFARKIVRRWVMQGKRLSRIEQNQILKVHDQEGSLCTLYSLSEDEGMSDADLSNKEMSHQGKEGLGHSLLEKSQGPPIPQRDSPYTSLSSYRRSAALYHPPLSPLPRSPTSPWDFTSYDRINHDDYRLTAHDPLDPAFERMLHDGNPWVPERQRSQQYSFPGTGDHNPASQVDRSPYQASLDTENQTDGLATYDCGMTIYRVQQPDGSISVEAYYPPEYPVALRGRRLGTLEKDKALELLEKAEKKSLKLVPVTREDGRRSVTPAPPSPNPGRRTSVQSMEEDPGALWGTQSQAGGTRPQSTRTSIDNQYLSPYDPGYGQTYSQPETPGRSVSSSAMQNASWEAQSNATANNYLDAALIDQHATLHDSNRPVLEDYSSQATLRCQLCSYTFHTVGSLAAHNDASHVVDFRYQVISSFSCIICVMSFYTRESLEMHLKYRHQPLRSLPQDETIDTSDSSLLQLAPTSSFPRNLCRICGVQFLGLRGAERVAEHMKSKHGYREGRVFVCEDDLCGRKFIRKEALVKHYRKFHPHRLRASPNPDRS